ncbi:MAG: MipA/OmpV family protein [Usitatibacteraceae bacterium]
MRIAQFTRTSNTVASFSMLLCVSTCALAEEADAPQGWSGTLGAGVASTATYEGSPRRRTTGVPILTLAYYDKSFGTFELGRQGLSWTMPDLDGFKAGVLLGLDAGRKDSKVSGGGFASGDERLRGMGDIKATPEVGLLVGYGPIGLTVRKSIGDKGHQGTQADLEARFPIKLTDALSLSIGAGATWADQKYMQAFFGVTSAQATASRFKRVFKPDSGIKKAEFTFGVEYNFTESWRAQTSIGVDTLLSEARKSPLAEKKSATTGFVGIAYSF